MDDGRGSNKRIRRNHQSSNALASSSNARHTNGVAQLRNNHNRMISENSLGQNFQPMPHLQVPNVNGSSLEGSSMGFQSYLQETISNRNGLRHPHPQPRAMPETTLAHRTLDPFGFVVFDGFALIDEEENLVDQYQDMRLDIDNMSYEELLALGERIGNVNTNLSMETIATHLMTKSYSPKPITINLEELPPDDQEDDACIICQDEFKKEEKIGILQCEHEYHVECITKWLLVKNTCPICKSEALTLGEKDE
uniref:RING-type E3 ubiquitin transferase n=1 Tax=Cicer arietinum TaxID=3827 RepID=A0A3Q7X0N3_CICAR|nr:probable E3 ubiquitin-protein ligase ZFP1 [Cicer arietinum]